MEGVTILSTTTVMLGIPWGIAILIALAAFIFMFIVISVLTVEDPIEYFYAAIVSAFATTIALIPLWVSIGSTEVTEYKVIIDDSVSYVEFMEKYEVIDQEGEIYTVRERTE